MAAGVGAWPYASGNAWSPDRPGPGGGAGVENSGSPLPPLCRFAGRELRRVRNDINQTGLLQQRTYLRKSFRRSARLRDCRSVRSVHVRSKLPFRRMWLRPVFGQVEGRRFVAQPHPDPWPHGRFIAVEFDPFLDRLDLAAFAFGRSDLEKRPGRAAESRVGRAIRLRVVRRVAEMVRRVAGAGRGRRTARRSETVSHKRTENDSRDQPNFRSAESDPHVGAFGPLDA